MSIQVGGVYRHFKGGRYRPLFVGRLSEQRDVEVVVYVSLTNGEIWVRPWKLPLLEGDDCWSDRVEWPDGNDRPRFVLDANYDFEESMFDKYKKEP